MNTKEKQKRLKEEGRMQSLSTTVGAAKKRNMKTFRDKKTGTEKAAVTKEDMQKAGFKSFGAQSLRKYLNMRNKLGRQPKTSDFETKFGAAVKKSQNKAIRNKQKENRKKDISSANKPNPNDPSYNVKKLKKTPPPAGGTSKYNKKLNPFSYKNPYTSRSKGSKAGDGDMFVKRAYGGKVGK
tara:strand:- start:521 stop:1066 length:546 start_codon:yes stop_codon:yes gene_type:complete